MEQTLQDWQQSPQQMVALGSIRTDPVLQPRDDKLIPFKDQYRVTRASEDHVARLQVALDGGKDVQLDPLLVAEIDGNLYLVDGHHRLKAYKKARRQTVPIRVLRCTKHQAVILSKLVNASGTKLPMTPEQSREAMWQYVAYITARGTKEAGMSYRALGGLFGVGKDTAGTMFLKVKELKLSEFPLAACDPVTRWPRWKYVVERVSKPHIEMQDPDQLRQWRTQKDAATIAKLLQRLGTARVANAIAALLAEASEPAEVEQLEGLRQWSIAPEPVVY